MPTCQHIAISFAEKLMIAGFIVFLNDLPHIIAYFEQANSPMGQGSSEVIYTSKGVGLASLALSDLNHRVFDINTCSLCEKTMDFILKP